LDHYQSSNSILQHSQPERQDQNPRIEPSNTFKQPLGTLSIDQNFQLTKEDSLLIIGSLRWGVAARFRVWVATNTESNFLAV
jgi:hypothetical protein